ncbi:hypothetical protein C0J08_19480 [Marinomonas sp. CT5]|uniref:hypothetical protein n=1 Tax=Marinomonas sp. CT5 TaxID=2066133 RepID=UPI001BB033B9|nr:hypothetical protein [Marinomonas sp. CT5]QUX97445.1 hypothetical protein C0J08_19480 [Marinomonas sp. CT5]
MSDFAAQHDDGFFEPDEETLISALRNQDDIPILMDVVSESVASSVSQEAHLAQSFDEAKHQAETSSSEVKSDEHKQADSAEIPQSHDLDDIITLDDVVNEPALSHAVISKAIADVLEKRLPELVSEVMQALQASSTDSNNKD